MKIKWPHNLFTKSSIFKGVEFDLDASQFSLRAGTDWNPKSYIGCHWNNLNFHVHYPVVSPSSLFPLSFPAPTVVRNALVYQLEYYKLNGSAGELLCDSMRPMNLS